MNSLHQIQKPTYFDPSVYEAAKDGDLGKIENFIKQGGWVDMPNEKGHSLLYYACKKGQIKVVQYLVNQDAHFYESRDLLNAMSVEVKQIVKAAQSTKNSNSALDNHISHLIEKAALDFKTIEDTLYFIRSIPSVTIREEALKDYASHLAFHDKNALSLLKYFEGREKNLIEKALVRAFIACGDITSARIVFEQTTEPATKQFLNFQLNAFMAMFEAIEKHFKDQPGQFPQTIAEGLRYLNILEGLSEKELVSLISALSNCGSFTAALKHIDTHLSPELRGFARCGISHCGLENMAIAASERANQLYDLQKEELTKSFDTLVKNMKEKSDIPTILDCISYFDDEENHRQALIKTIIEICSLGFYEEAFNQLNKMDITHEEVQNLIGQIVQHLEEMNEDGKEWADKFSSLLNKK